MPIIKPRKMATVLVPEDVHKKLKAQAKREGRQLQIVVERIFTEALKSSKTEALNA